VAPKPVPVDRHGLRAALTLFVTRFVIEDKRDQMHQRLLAAERRGETLVAVVRWIQGTRTQLEGADRSPAGLQARFGEVTGVYLDEDGARRTTIAVALDLGRARPSLFIGDTGRIAMITNVDGPPVLCSWP
jgi:hypothetical protein